MLTKLVVRNFKRFDELDLELGQRVVLIGPNNSGKTSAMQALALWDTGVKKWHEKRAGKDTPKKRSGVTINRRDLIAIPHPHANLLWHGRQTRNVNRSGGKPKTSNIRIEVVVEGVANDRTWECGLEFDYANEESFYCRPLRTANGDTSERMPVPDEAASMKVAFLPPMSGLAETETRLDPGAVNVRIGEGRTAEILRNLCWQIAEENPPQWESLAKQLESLFGAKPEKPRYIPERGQIVMEYKERRNLTLDLSSSGRGLQQTLLILAYMHTHRGAVILLDEPDAHLEILRQREIYSLIDQTASENGSQIIAASHSEVLLNEAAEKDIVIAFVGNRPHRIADRGSQLRKALVNIRYDDYYQAEQTGWVLYLEGSTDLAILQAFATRLGHRAAQKALERPFVHYVRNEPNKATEHFHGLREALPDLKGIALFDRLESGVRDHPQLTHLMWQQREIENYLCTPSTLVNFAQSEATKEALGSLFSQSEHDRRSAAMKKAIERMRSALENLGKGDPWGPDLKVSDEFLDPVFKAYYDELGLPNLMSKTNFHILAGHVPENEIDPEVSTVLDAIVATKVNASPATG